MSGIVPSSGIPALTSAPSVGATTVTKDSTSFSDAIGRALDAVSAAEHEVDSIAVDIASGGDREVHELMAAMSKASLSVDLLVQTRNRALEAYTEIMRMQI